VGGEFAWPAIRCSWGRVTAWLGGGGAGAAAAAKTLLANGETRIGIIRNGQVIVVSPPNTTHQALAQQAGVYVSRGKLAEGYEAFTILKEGGQIHVRGSLNFGGIMKISDQAIQALKALYE
jgi:hypothetical protein